VEGKCTSRGPRIVEVNARLGGGRIWNYVEAVWEVDLVEAHLRSSLDLPPQVKASRRPRRGVVDVFVFAPTTGRLAAVPIADLPTGEQASVTVDVQEEVGAEVNGPDKVFASVLAEVSVIGKDLRHARALADSLLREPPRVEPAPSGSALPDTQQAP
jgi:carnosine synthase